MERKPTVYGYCRTSTPKQSLTRQVEKVLRAYPDAYIFEEAFTGTKIKRPEFSRLLRAVSPGDTIIFDEVSRMSRNAEEGFNLYRELYEKGVNLVFLSNPLVNTELYRKAAQVPETGNKDFDETLRVGINQFLIRLSENQFRLAFEKSQEEVEHLHRRTSEGMKAAGATNKYDQDGNLLEHGTIAASKLGRKITTKKSISTKEIIRKHNRDFGGSLSDAETIKLAGCARNSYFKYKRELKAEIDA